MFLEAAFLDEKSPKNHTAEFNCFTNDLEHYKCPNCPNFQTDCLTDIKHHLRNNHVPLNQTYNVYKCTMCHFETYSKYVWIMHNFFDNCDIEQKTESINVEIESTSSLSKYVMRNFTCEYCLRKYSNENTLAVHKKRFHMNWFSCAQCSYRTKHKPFLVYHMRILHKPEFFQCNICPYKAKAKSSFNHHRILKHELGKWLQCGHCTYKAVAKWRMLQHHKRHKTVTNPRYYITDRNLTEWLNCEQCNFKTKSKEVLKRHHMDKHSNLFNCVKSNIDSYECCCENFRTNFLAELFRHIEDGHPVQESEKIQKYRCQNCDFKTYSEYLFVRHNLLKQCVIKENIKSLAEESGDEESNNEEIKWLKCDQCQYVTKNKCYLKSHMNTHDKRFNCQYCAYKTATKYSLHIHSKMMHAENLQWHQCDQCSFKTKFRGNLTKHLKRHSATWIKCDLCFFKTKHIHNLNLHKMSKHDIGTKWFSCDRCIFQTKREYSLKLHKQALHGISMKLAERKPEKSGQILLCKKCRFKCKSRDELRAHQKDHEEKKHQCQYCSHRTKRGYNLKLHVIQKHSDKTEIQWLQCDQCDFKTKTKSILKRHVLERHSEEWVYCAHCSSRAKSKRLLISHLQSVHDIGKIILFECADCGFTTKQRTNLKVHQRKHEKERLRAERGN